MERRSKVIWTCGPSGGATVKHLTIKQLNCALPASLSGKLIQCVAWMILSIRGEKKKPHGQPECLYSNKATLRSHRRWSNHQRENKPNARTGNKKCHYLPIYHVQLLCPMSRSDVSLRRCDLFVFVIGEENASTSGIKLSSFLTFPVIIPVI